MYYNSNNVVKKGRKYFMTQLEKIKKDISEITQTVEFAGYLDGIKTAAILYCMTNYPQEVSYDDNNQIRDVSVNGMCCFLENNVD